MSLSARRMSLALVMAGAALALASDQPALPAPHCPLDATVDQCYKYRSSLFAVNGFAVVLFYEVNNNLITLECNHFQQLDAVETLQWLPRFTPALHVDNVTLLYCPPVHYATVLAALNVMPTSPFNFEIQSTRQDGPLTAAHFADLPPLRHLTLQEAGALDNLPASLEGLTTLTIKNMERLNKTILDALPRSLTKLRLDGVGITRVPAAVLDLPELSSLYLKPYTTREYGVVERSNASRLRQLDVFNADAALMSDWAPPALEEVTLRHWHAERPNPLPACDKLAKLTLYSPRVSDLPAGWVARCPRLKELLIDYTYFLSELPARLLENATQLTNLRITNIRLSSLPAHLFADTPHLTHLNLYGNQLKELPSSMLTLPLFSLDLGRNRLTTSEVAKLATFTELRNLSLSWNRNVRDLCAVNHNNVTEHKMKSSLVALLKLERLDLYSTNVSVICSDWREDMVNLKYLDLRDTMIRNLTYEDLEFKRSVPAVVKLAGTIYFTADDYDRAAAAGAVAPRSRNVTVMLSRQFKYYNCSLYWITKALNGDLLPLYDLHFGDNTMSLRTGRAEDLLCPSREICATVPSGCDCGMAGGGLLRVVCVGVKLDRVLQLPSLTADFNAIDLVLSNNSITELAVDDLPPYLRVLDLRNNSISYMTETTARALVSGTKRRVLLAGNRLECSCRATPALRVLRDHVAVLVGYDALRCEDGRTLEDAVDACWTPALR